MGMMVMVTIPVVVWHFTGAQVRSEVLRQEK